MPLEADFDLLPESELELIPLSPDTGYLRANGSLVQATEIEAPEAANDESPGGQESAANAMLPDLAGDAGIIAFDWRGADDFRIFTVGIAG
uniref:Uncharacterized protein n=1 Tax=Kalmanozyma brasiliensis (strain GHG001) TaxID=1365824 RepID=V5ELV3_KALBG